jgi:hypothetical protein
MGLGAGIRTVQGGSAGAAAAGSGARVFGGGVPGSAELLATLHASHCLCVEPCSAESHREPATQGRTA